jgi:hypothetical protein
VWSPPFKPFVDCLTDPLTRVALTSMRSVHFEIRKCIRFAIFDASLSYITLNGKTAGDPTSKDNDSSELSI